MAGDPLKILFTSDYLDPNNIGGSGRVIIELARALKSYGHRVGILAGSPIAEEGVLEFGRETLEYRSFPYSVAQGRGLRFLMRARRDMSREFRAWPWTPDVVIHNQPLTAAAMGTGGVPTVYIFHSPWPLELLADQFGEDSLARLSEHGTRVRWGVKLRRYVESRALSGAQAWVTLSQTMKQHLSGLYGIEQGVHVLPGGVDMGRFVPLEENERRRQREQLGVNDEDVLWVCVRRLVPRTGVDLLLESFAQSLGDNPNACLRIAGKGSELESLKQRAQALQLGSRVQFLGYVPDAELPRIYSAADATVVPTRALEGFGLSTLESLSCETPVVATPVGGTVEILRDFCPELLAERVDPAALAAVLYSWQHNRQSLRALRGGCRPFVEQNFSWRKMATGLEQVMQSLLTKPLPEPLGVGE